PTEITANSQPIRAQSPSMATQSADNTSQFFECLTIGGKVWFVCRHKDCHHCEKTELKMFGHLTQHMDTSLGYQSHEDIEDIETESDGRVMIDLSDESNGSDIVTADRSGGQSTAGHSSGVKEESVDEEWRQWFKLCDGSGGKERLVCMWSDCGFETNLRIAARRHVNKHLSGVLAPKKTPTTTSAAVTESVYWDQIFPDCDTTSSDNNVAQSEATNTRLSGSASKIKSKTKGKGKQLKGKRGKQLNVTKGVNREKETKLESQISPMIDISVTEEGLSLKGMGISNLKAYIETEVINGQKWYLCRHSSSCEFKCRLSKQIALHIHCSHIGLSLKCPQVGCGRVFRTPNSWREHQKYHICNFDNKKGAIGVCRKDNIDKWREIVIIEDPIKGSTKAYRCKWKGCAFTTLTSDLRRHIHNQHICPFRTTGEWKKKFRESLDNCSQQSDPSLVNAMVDGLQKKNLLLCRIKGCVAKFADKSDRNRHEKLCPLRPKTIKTITSTNKTKTLLKARVRDTKEVKSETSGRLDGISGNSNKGTESTNELFCGRDGCKSKFNRTIDLKKHQIWCQFRPKATNTQSSKKLRNRQTLDSKANKTDDNIQKNMNDSKILLKTKSIEKVKEESVSKAKDNKKMVENTDNPTVIENAVTSHALDSICEKYMQIKLFEGARYLICNHMDCKFVTKIGSKFNDHVMAVHLANRPIVCDLKRTPKQELVDDSKKGLKRNSKEVKESTSKCKANEEIDDKGKQSSPLDKEYLICNFKNCKFCTKSVAQFNAHIKLHSRDVSINTKLSLKGPAVGRKRGRPSAKSKAETVDTKPKILKTTDKRDKPNTDCRKELKPNTDCRKELKPKTEPTNEWEIYVEKKCIDSEPNFFCKYDVNLCRFYAKDVTEVYEHIRDKHTFKCNLQNCDKQFKNQNLLDIHKRNHICGFGIKGMKPMGVCAVDNVRQYRAEKREDNRCLYSCLWLNCCYETDNRNTCLMHIHNRHICVNKRIDN
ncbi:unnamed protein product, partial [Medioppia subpectinata]